MEEAFPEPRRQDTTGRERGVQRVLPEFVMGDGPGGPAAQFGLEQLITKLAPLPVTCRNETRHSGLQFQFRREAGLEVKFKVAPLILDETGSNM